MNLMELGAIGELVGGAAVIASLVYVGLQLRQNTQVSRAQSIANRLSGQIAADLALVGHDGASALARSFEEPAQLTTAEIFQVWGYLFSAMAATQSSYETYTLGLSSRKEWEDARDQAAGYLGFEFGRAWWNVMRRSYYPSDFSAEIDEALSKADPNALKNQLDELTAAVRRLA